MNAPKWPGLIRLSGDCDSGMNTETKKCAIVFADYAEIDRLRNNYAIPLRSITQFHYAVLRIITQFDYAELRKSITQIYSFYAIPLRIFTHHYAI